jgi:hypothetical protein
MIFEYLCRKYNFDIFNFRRKMKASSDEQIFELISSKTGVCYHEAGHAVIAYSHGDKIGSISIEPAGKLWQGSFRRSPYDADSIVIINEVERLLAGVLAPYIHFNLPTPKKIQAVDISNDDRDRIVSFSKLESPNPEQYIKTMINKARRTLDRYFTTVSALAEKLETEETIEGASLFDLLKNSNIPLRDTNKRPSVFI